MSNLPSPSGAQPLRERLRLRRQKAVAAAKVFIGPTGSRRFAVMAPVLTAAIIATSAGVFKLGDLLIDKRDAPDPPRPTLASSVVTNQDEIVVASQPVGATYVIPSARADLKAPPKGAQTSCTGRYKWAMAQKGVVADSLNLRVTLTPKHSRTLTLTGVQIVPTKTSKPVAGIVATCSGGGSNGPAAPSLLSTSLSQDAQPTRRFEDSDGAVVDFVYDMPESTTATFDVAATAVDCDCSFFLRVTGTQNGKPVKFDVKDGRGRPFRVTSSARGDLATYIPSQKRWALQQTGDVPQARPLEDFRLAQLGAAACDAFDPNEFRGATGQRLDSGAGSPQFQLQGDAATSRTVAAVCGWNVKKKPAADGSVPSLGIQQWVGLDTEAAVRVYDELRSQFDSQAQDASAYWRKRSLAGQTFELLTEPGSAVVMARRDRSVLVFTATAGIRPDWLEQAAAQTLSDVG